MTRVVDLVSAEAARSSTTGSASDPAGSARSGSSGLSRKGLPDGGHRNPGHREPDLRDPGRRKTGDPKSLRRGGAATDAATGPNSGPNSGPKPGPKPGPQPDQDPLALALQRVLTHHGVTRSLRSLVDGLPSTERLTPHLAARALSAAGCATRVVARAPDAINGGLLPAILLLRDGGAAVLLQCHTTTDGPAYVLHDAGTDKPRTVAQAELLSLYGGHCLLVRPPLRTDDRGEEAQGSSPSPTDRDPAPARADGIRGGGWMWRTVWRYRAYYRDAVLASVLINLLSIATALFSMHVFDRVIPHQAYATLWTLAAGVGIAMLFEVVARHLRGSLLDLAGKKADVALSSALFSHALGLRLDRKPDSSGTLAHQLREFESVRDFGTSASLAVVADVPFIALFIALIFVIGGDLGLIPLAAVPLSIALAAVMQWPLRRLMASSHREAARMQGLMVESIDGLETLRATGATGAMQRRFEDFSASTSLIAVRTRQLTNLITHGVQFVQQAQMVGILLAGTYLIHDGRLTPGALMAAVMLGNRAVAPLGNFSALAARYQGARAAMATLNRLMALPTEREPGREYIAQPKLAGGIRLAGASLRYASRAARGTAPALAATELVIRPGERVAIIGKIGSGKSTLLRLMSGLYPASDGQVQLDGLDLRQIDPADRRAHIGFVGQEARLFHGSLRENVMLDRPEVSWEGYLDALRLTGLDQITAGHPMGHELPIGEGGAGLSGGQRQLVALARTLVTRPKILLLDEPTSAMDLQTEDQFIHRLQAIIGRRTLVVVTHRPSVLKLLDRVIVVDQGRIVADGPRAEVLAWLGGGKAPVTRVA